MTAGPSDEQPDPPVLGGLLDGFEGHIQPDPETWGTVLRKGTVVLDTSAILDAYRMSPGARGEFLSVLRTLRDRLFVPYQVAHEFHGQRVDVIAHRQKEFKAFAGQVRGYLENARKAILQHAERARPDSDRVKILIGSIDSLFDQVQKLANELRAEYDLDASKATLGEDQLLDELIKVFEGRVNRRPSEGQRNEDHREAERRLRYEIPPGFGDADKGSAAVGDYLWWAEVVRYAAALRRPVLVVTNDVTKGDWMLRRRGIEIGAHPLLVEEIRRTAGVRLLVATVSDLLKLARSQLDATVNDSTVREADAIRASFARDRKRGRLMATIHRQAATSADVRLVSRDDPFGSIPGVVGANLSSFDLSGLNLGQANFRSMLLSRAKLNGTNLSMASVNGDLSGTDFSNADLWRATLSGDLTGAILTGANLSEANLAGAKGLTQEQIDQAKGDTGTVLPSGLRYPAHWPDNMRYPGRER